MNDPEWQEPHCIAQVLKMFLEELPNPLFTDEKYMFFINAFNGKYGLLIWAGFPTAQVAYPWIHLTLITLGSKSVNPFTPELKKYILPTF